MNSRGRLMWAAFVLAVAVVPGCQNVPPIAPPGDGGGAAAPVSQDSCVTIAKDAAALESLRNKAVALVLTHNGDQAEFDRNIPADDAVAQCEYFQKVINFYSVGSRRSHGRCSFCAYLS